MTELLKRILTPSLEDDSSGTIAKEVEHVYYGRFVDMDQLKKAKSMEMQEQWGLRIHKTDKNANSGDIRIRKSTIGDKVEYVLTTKTNAGGTDKLELGIATTEDNFKQFQQLAESGMLKHRFIFAFESSDLVAELDLFLKPDGSYHEWCKVDIEVDDKSVEIPELPFKLEDMITAPFGKRTHDEEAMVTSLFKDVFKTPNIYVTK